MMVCAVALLLGVLPASPHSSWQQHARDMMDVFGMQWDARRAPKNAEVKQWARYISSDMIDNVSFHKQLMSRHPGFPNISTPRRHRMLFHWGYDAQPWNAQIEREVRTYCDQRDLNVEINLRVIKSEIRAEQQRRNRMVNAKTETLFGFAHGGQDAAYARFFASMAYNVHILGDYTSDNTVLDGLQPIGGLIGQIVTDLRRLDPVESRAVIKEITAINRQQPRTQLKADALMACLKRNVPSLVRRARQGTIYRRLQKQGVGFVTAR